MKIAKYHRLDGSIFEVEYDENAPCIRCGLPVVSASMGGTVICPWCDCGYYRDGEPQGFDSKKLIKKRAKEKNVRHAKMICREGGQNGNEQNSRS